MEQLNYNLLFRWFVGLPVDDPVWVPTLFSKNRDRLLEGDIAAAFMSAVLNLPQVTGLLSDERFSVDGALIKPDQSDHPAVASTYPLLPLAVFPRTETDKIRREASQEAYQRSLAR